jgi:hypothetical protein
MSQNAAPQSGDIYLQFNGKDAYVEIPSIADYSVATTGALSVAAWIRPSTLNFPNVEPNSDYIHWLGKGDKSGSQGNQEWTFRMYNYSTPLEDPPRSNRISFYVFNPQGRLGVGSYVQVEVEIGRWMHVVGMADDARTYFYKDGQYVRCSTYRGPAQDGCEIQEQNGVQVVVNPQPGPAALRLGTKDLGSFLEGGLSRVRLWNRTLTAAEISSLYATDMVPRDGLVAEFLLSADTGSVANDTAQGNDGSIVNALWVTQT